MQQVNIHTAKAQLSKLISKGEEVVIARYGQPVAKLVPIKQLKEDRVPGTAKGKVRMSDRFFNPLPDDVLDEFYK
ncbi:MAG: type II toxin-antitoxin system Phd/YefM family antitoxin [Deltaproteobacteria bacterium]|nr:MAG: type II toxin-antitoxin system Phd/YefM family antitoxin [Deltaproteobacteria bacterium]